MSFLLLATLFLATTAPSGTQSVLSVPISSNKGAVDLIADLTITAAITNKNAHDIKVLKYGTILDADLPTRSFTLSLSLAGPNDAAYTTISAGKTVTVVHNVSELFDFASVGAGQFSFAPVTKFQGLPVGHNSSAGTTKHSTVTATSNMISVVVTRDAPERTQVVPRSTYYLCTDSKKRAFTESRCDLLPRPSAGKDYIGRYGASNSLYVAYFGANPSTSVSSVLDGVANVRSSAVSMRLQCTETDICDKPGIIAYAYTDFPLINYCEEFFQTIAPTRDLCRYRTERSETTVGISVHESSDIGYPRELPHAISATDDKTYGCEQSRALSDPEKIHNADSFNCFTAAVYKRTKC
ncbi:hypothetical protein DFH06DRAFT_1345900 [Mycena polygramma]|nr:hypothetical protein DFH06DRAFT_1345900 [Mycena polygramma]